MATDIARLTAAHPGVTVQTRECHQHNTATTLRCNSIQNLTATMQRHTKQPFQITVQQRCIQSARVGVHEQRWPLCQPQNCSAYSTQVRTSQPQVLLLLQCCASHSHAWSFVRPSKAAVITALIRATPRSTQPLPCNCCTSVWHTANTACAEQHMPCCLGLQHHVLPPAMLLRIR